MNKLLLVTLPAVAVVFFSCGPTTDQAIDYNEKIINQEKAVVESEGKLIDGLYDSDASLEDVELQRTLLLATVTGAQAVVIEEGKFDEENKFGEAAKSLFATYHDVTKNEYKEVIELLGKEDYTEEDDARVEELLGTIDEKLDSEMEKFTVAQEDFAAKYNFELEDEEEVEIDLDM